MPMTAGGPSALAAFEATGRAYLAFARKHPGHYIAMFESGVGVNRTPELAAAAARARGVLERAAEDLSRHIPPEKRPPRGDVLRPCLGDEPRRRRTLRTAGPGPRVALSARGIAGKRDRHLPSRPGPHPARRVSARATTVPPAGIDPPRWRQPVNAARRAVPTVTRPPKRERAHRGALSIRCDTPQRLENWKLRRALARPYFLRSTTRLSRVRKPAALSGPRRAGS